MGTKKSKRSTVQRMVPLDLYRLLTWARKEGSERITKLRVSCLVAKEFPETNKRFYLAPKGLRHEYLGMIKGFSQSLDVCEAMHDLSGESMERIIKVIQEEAKIGKKGGGR